MDMSAVFGAYGFIGLKPIIYIMLSTMILSLSSRVPAMDHGKFNAAMVTRSWIIADCSGTDCRLA